MQTKMMSYEKYHKRARHDKSWIKITWLDFIILIFGTYVKRTWFILSMLPIPFPSQPERELRFYNLTVLGCD